MGWLANLPAATNGVDLLIRRQREQWIGPYRDLVWAIFSEIVWTTPQYTGQAAANWNLGVGAPDNTFDPSLGDEQRLTKSGNLSKAGIRRMGDPQWVMVALQRAYPKLQTITRDNHKVFITNKVEGDDDHGKSSTYYMESLQDAGYWAAKLRAANKPYETAEEVYLKHMTYQQLGIPAPSFKDSAWMYAP